MRRNDRRTVSRPLFSSWMAMGRGLQQMQHACLEIFDQSMENAVHKPQDLLRCKTVVEVAEVQRDLTPTPSIKPSNRAAVCSK